MEVLDMLAAEVREMRKELIHVREHMAKEKDLKDMRKEMSALKVTVASFSSFFGVVGAYLHQKFFK